MFVLWLIAILSCQLGCALDYTDTTAVMLENVPDEEWKPIPLEEIVASEDKFKGKRVRFYVQRLQDDELGTNVVVVERIDSTFVYGWYQWPDYAPKRLIKIKLQKITKAEIYKSHGLEATVWVWAAVIVIPLVVVIFVSMSQF